MSTAFFPTNMRSMPAGGKNHRSTYENIPYVSWKGTGVFSNPVGNAPSHIRPLTNNDTGNVFMSGSFPSRVSNVRIFNPRPLKHYRKGRVIPSTPITGVPNLVAANPYNKNMSITIPENELINYNMNRYVASSKGQSLGGGSGGSGLLNDILDYPGSYIVKQNPPNETSETTQLDTDCVTCKGVGVVTNYYPNNTYLTDNPDKNTENNVWCCNAEKKALKRVLPPNTILKKNYYTTLQQYRQNRCKTFVQREFNFQTINPTNILELNSSNPFITPLAIASAKPGSSLALLNTYAANCQPNGLIDVATEHAMIVQMTLYMVSQNILTPEQVQQINFIANINLQSFFNYLKNLPEPTQSLATAVFVGYINYLTFLGIPISGPTNPAQCKAVVYKPNNYQFAKQGAVASSTSTLKLKVDTITTNAASFNNYNANMSIPYATTEITDGIPVFNPFVLKSKTANCNVPPIYPYQNKKSCYYNSQLPSYQIPVSQPSPYRYYPSTVFSSNHYSPSSITYLSR
jgi:hypothetical protein